MLLIRMSTTGVLAQTSTTLTSSTGVLWIPRSAALGKWLLVPASLELTCPIQRTRAMICEKTYPRCWNLFLSQFRRFSPRSVLLAMLVVGCLQPGSILLREAILAFFLVH